MSSTQPSKISKSILKGVKGLLFEQGFPASTKHGNKELKHLVDRLAVGQFESHEQALDVGKRLGQKILSESTSKKKTQLDAGVVRLITLQSDLFEALGVTQPAQDSSISRSKSKTPKTFILVDLSETKSSPSEPPPTEPVSSPDAAQSPEESIEDEVLDSEVESSIAENKTGNFDSVENDSSSDAADIEDASANADPVVEASPNVVADVEESPELEEPADLTLAEAEEFPEPEEPAIAIAEESETDTDIPTADVPLATETISEESESDASGIDAASDQVGELVAEEV